MIIRKKGRSRNRSAVAHAANFDEVADGERRDPDSEPEDDTTEPNTQDPNEHEECKQDADRNPSFELEDELEPWVDYMVRNPQNRSLVGRTWYHVVDPQTQQDVLETSKNETCLHMEPGDVNQAESEDRKTNQEMGRRHPFTPATNQSSQETTTVTRTTRLRSRRHNTA